MPTDILLAITLLQKHDIAYFTSAICTAIDVYATKHNYDTIKLAEYIVIGIKESKENE